MSLAGEFPRSRLRRLRSDAWVRALVRETVLRPADLIWPVFVVEGNDVAQPIASLPGQYRYSLDRLVPELERAAELGIPLVALFPVTEPSKKSADGREATNPKNLVCRAIRTVKEALPELGVMADVALDPFTTHGHDGLLDEATGEVRNDETVAVLVEQALVQAQAGCDVLGPSDMMDGRVRAIRVALEAKGHKHTKIMAYSAKYASALYGPFRDAVGSQGNLAGKGKHTYQQDPANREEALREAALDVAEGADMIMVKPGGFYLDVIHVLKQELRMPTFAYHVSGEYAMIHAAAQNGWLDGDGAMYEALLSHKRAGADGILTYAARDIAATL